MRGGAQCGESGAGPRSTCPCCGHRTLSAPRDYQLCPVCSWEDDGVHLRWPMRPDGANGQSLVEAQRAYARLGAITTRARRHVRRPRPDEPRDEEWRPFDPAVDWTHPELDGERWPHHPDALAYWRETYWAGVVDRLPAPARAPTGGDHLVEHLRATLPEARPVIEHHEWLRGRAAPMAVCRDLGAIAGAAYRHGDEATGLRVVEALAPALDEEAATYAPNCVVIGLLDGGTWDEPTMAAYVEAWPALVRAEVEERRAGAAEMAAQVEAWEATWSGAAGRPVADLEAELDAVQPGVGAHHRDCLARVMSDPAWLRHHPLDSLVLAWRHRRAQAPWRTLRWLARPRLAG